MKKKMIALLAGALMMLSASSAFATFADNDLIRYVYNTSTGNETVTDLGSVSSLLSGASAAGGSLNLNTNLFTSGAGLGSASDASLMVGYVAGNISGASANQVWVSATNGATQIVNTSNYYAGFQNSISSVFGGLQGNYDPTGAAQQSTNWKTDTSSAAYSFNPQGQAGTFGGYLTSADGEASLANLATASIKQGLFYWADGTATTNSQAATILTNADGSTTIQTTPIPAAIYLMGSGLLGMFGLRRKQRG